MPFGAETYFFALLSTKSRSFAKTGSGQTQEEQLPKRHVSAGLGGNSVKLTQPRKNGGEDIEGELALWWQGDMEPASTMNFLRFSLVRVSGLSSAKVPLRLSKKGQRSMP